MDSSSEFCRRNRGSFFLSAAYIFEKRLSPYPDKFGTGIIEGVAAPEWPIIRRARAHFSSSDAWIPSNVVMAVLLGALLIHGLTPGPLLMKKHPDLFWGVIGSMYVGNCMLLLLNLPLIGLWVKLLKVPYSIMFPMILFFCLVGVYTVNNNL